MMMMAGEICMRSEKKIAMKNMMVALGVGGVCEGNGKRSPIVFGLSGKRL